MIKIDLITGFLGSGKTTFLKKYITYLKSIGEKVCVIENDFGAINVDTMLINDFGCDIETVQGGNDYDCHMRRFKTKLIQIALMGYTRVVVEPSGIFDTDLFFDSLYEEPISNWYNIGNIFCIYDIFTKDLSDNSEYIFVSEASCASKIIVSKRDKRNLSINLDYINNIMKKFKSSRIFTSNDIVYNDDLDFDTLINASYVEASHIKLQVINDNNFDTLYIMDKKLNLDDINFLKDELLNSNKYGNVLRIKGFIFNDNCWHQVNFTKEDNLVEKIKVGQDVVIVIGENLEKDKILNLIEKNK